MTDRRFDVVLFGATGFTGGLTAEYLADHAPPGLRWAVAGRNRAKLEAVVAGLDAEPEILVADAADSAALREIAASTKVLATTVGPYRQYGEPLVAACAEAGTDYVDITGEPEFVDTMYVRHHDAAVASGARLIHCCGFDSIPHDLGAQFCVEQLPEGVPLTVRAYVVSSAQASGGTTASAGDAVSRLRIAKDAAKARRTKEGRPTDRSIRGDSKIHRQSRLGRFGFPLPTIDPQIVLRSAAASERYGPAFTYGHFAGIKNPVFGAAVFGGLGALVAAMQVPPLRKAITRRRPPGTGPTPDQRAKSWFRVSFVGEGGGKSVLTEVSGGDPGYDETSKMLAESALCLAFDELPATSGQVTTATAMGPALRERLQRAGMSFRVVTPS